MFRGRVVSIILMTGGQLLSRIGTKMETSTCGLQIVMHLDYDSFAITPQIERIIWHSGFRVTGKHTNRDAIGARVEVFLQNKSANERKSQTAESPEWRLLD